MSISDTMMIISTLVSPILAIQVQKFIEHLKERSSKKHEIFHALMANRANHLSPERVNALNLIDMNFTKKREKKVIEAWKELLDKFSNFPEIKNFTEQTIQEYNSEMKKSNEQANNLFINLLYEMSQSLGYNFDKVHIKNSCYAPIGHAEQENSRNLIIQGVVDLLSGRIPLNMNVISMPDTEPHQNIIDFLKIASDNQDKAINILQDISTKLENTPHLYKAS